MTTGPASTMQSGSECARQRSRFALRARVVRKSGDVRDASLPLFLWIYHGPVEANQLTTATLLAFAKWLRLASGRTGGG